MTEHTLRAVLTRITFRGALLAPWNLRYQVHSQVLTTGGGVPSLVGWHVRLAFDTPGSGLGWATSRPAFVGCDADQAEVLRICLPLARLTVEQLLEQAMFYGDEHASDAARFLRGTPA